MHIIIPAFTITVGEAVGLISFLMILAGGYRLGRAIKMLLTDFLSLGFSGNMPPKFDSWIGSFELVLGLFLFVTCLIY